MSIYKNNKKVIALYKGATPIKSVMKGSVSVFQSEGGGSDEPEIETTNILSFEWELKNGNATGNTFYMKVDGANKYYTVTDNPYSLDLATVEGTDFGIYIHNVTVTNYISVPSVLTDSSIENLVTSYNNEEVTIKNVSFTKTTQLNDIFVSNFNFNSNIKKVNFSGCKFPNLTYASGIFDSIMRNVEEINLSYWNTPSLTEVSGLFRYCSKLKTLNVTGWDVSNCEEVGAGQYIFNSCNSLEKIILGRCSQAVYDWWYQKLVDVNLQGQVTIQATII